MSQDRIRTFLNNSADLKRAIADTMTEDIDQAVDLVRKSIKNGGKLLLMGNGGSAGDAQHIAAELVGRYKKERQSVPALALTVDTSALTAIGNDYGFEEVFSRQIEGLGQKGDVLLAISTSGLSENVIRGVQQARVMGIQTIGLLGKEGGKLKDIVDLALVVPSQETARIQEAHITIGHIICEILDDEF